MKLHNMHAPMTPHKELKLTSQNTLNTLSLPKCLLQGVFLPGRFSLSVFQPLLLDELVSPGDVCVSPSL